MSTQKNKKETKKYPKRKDKTYKLEVETVSVDSISNL
jgi:hypothetical protein